MVLTIFESYGSGASTGANRLTFRGDDWPELVQLAPAFRQPVLQVDLRRLGLDDHVPLQRSAEPDYQLQATQ